MKRTNPKTNLPFKRGDVREDGYVFFNYTNRIKADGFFAERWLHPENSNKAKEKDKIAKKGKYQRKSTRLPQNYKTLLNNDPRAISQFKHCWRLKTSDPDITAEDLEEMMVGYEQYLYLLLPDKQ